MKKANIRLFLESLTLRNRDGIEQEKASGSKSQIIRGSPTSLYGKTRDGMQVLETVHHQRLPQDSKQKTKTLGLSLSAPEAKPCWIDLDSDWRSLLTQWSIDLRVKVDPGDTVTGEQVLETGAE